MNNNERELLKFISVIMFFTISVALYYIGAGFFQYKTLDIHPLFIIAGITGISAIVYAFIAKSESYLGPTYDI